MALNKIKINNTTTVNTGVVYDITKATGQSYDSLSAAIGTNGNNVPLEIREGGMSIRFVSNSDNKYVQYRLTADEWSTDTENWVIAGESVYVENPYYIKVTTDSEDKILEGITSKGTKQINIPIDTPSATIEHVKNPEWISVIMDNEGKILEGITSEGKKKVMAETEIEGINVKEKFDKLSDKLENTSIRNLNKDKEQYIKSAAKFDRRHQSIEDYNIPLIMVTTDVHNRFDQLKRAMDFTEEIDEVVCTLCLGDFVRNWNDLTQEVANELFTTYDKPIFRIIGNHELLYNNVLDPEHSPSLSDLMNLFYTSTMNQHNGDIHPEGKPWWYYDVSYPTSGFKLRFIGLCQYEDTSVYNYASYSLEQLTWLCNTLESTDSNTYIVLLQHTVNATMRREDIYNEDFTIADYLWFSDGFPGTEIVNQIVDAWMYGKNLSYTSEQTGVTIEHTFSGNNAERFVCYLCGHEHADGVYTHPVFVKQICITLDCTSGDWWQSWNDTHQIKDTTARDSVTLFAFDPYTRMIKLIRLGANVTNDMKLRIATSITLPKV